MLSPGNVATPLTAAWVSVPASVPLLAFVPIATVISPLNPVPVLPPASCAVTSTAGVIAAPAVVVLGCTLNTNCVAVPAVILNAALVVLPALGRARCWPGPTFSMLRPGLVAHQLPAEWVCVRWSVPLLPLVSIGHRIL